MKKLLYLIWLNLLLISNILNAQFYESQILEYGGDAQALGSGSVSAARIFSPAVYILSPASSADVEIPVLSFTYGDILGFNNFLQISYLQPTSRGVVSGNIRYFGANALDQGLNNATGINLNFSKVFTEKLFVGLGLNFLKAEYYNDDGITLGLNLGGIYHFQPYTAKRENKFLKNFRIGFNIINIGSYLSLNDVVISPPITLRTGPSASFNIINHVDTILSADFIFRKANEFSIGFGLENMIKEKISLRLGYQIESDFATFSAGAGYKFQVNNIQPEINYAFVSTRNNETEHFLGANIYFGSVDTSPPDTALELNLKDFSPNYDGNADYLEITPAIDDNKVLRSWEIEILDQNNKPVKKYTSPDIDTLKGKLTLKKVFTRLFEKKKEAPVPDKIVWDGIDEKGTRVKDGQYKIIAKALDEKRNEATTKALEFKVDNTPPEVSLRAESHIFSPNGDGVKDSVKIDLDLIAENDDEFSAVIQDKEGTVMKTYKWEGKKITQVDWDGKTDRNVLAPDGNYDFIVRGKDRAGNVVKRSVREITLTTAKQSVAISADIPAFSPNGDGIMDKVVLETYISDSNGLQRWLLTITDNDGKKTKTFEGQSDVPKDITWEGIDSNGKPVTDGLYYYRFEAWYDSGNHPESFPKQILVDQTPPSIKLKFEPDIFSPDGDEENDIIKFLFNVEDKSLIKKWTIVISETSSPEKTFKKFEGSGIPAGEILWNGVSDDGKLVQSKNKYYVFAFVEDVLGNKTYTEKIQIKIDTKSPDVDFEFEPEMFSPDGDGENDLLKIKIFSYDKKKIKSWKLNIYPIRSGKRESLFIDWDGKELPGQEILWDGRDKKGELVESAMDYALELIVEDILGNIRTVNKTMSVDVLVIKTPYGWRIKISNIEFAYNKADLRGNAFKILERVMQILEKFPTYNVRIEGHTDNIGTMEYNLDLSKRRAESVYNYLVKEGIKADKLNIIGLAFKYPVAPNDTEEGRAKNRRVEFILIKPGAKAPERE